MKTHTQKMTQRMCKTSSQWKKGRSWDQSAEHCSTQPRSSAWTGWLGWGPSPATVGGAIVETGWLISLTWSENGSHFHVCSAAATICSHSQNGHLMAFGRNIWLSFVGLSPLMDYLFLGSDTTFLFQLSCPFSLWASTHLYQNVYCCQDDAKLVDCAIGPHYSWPCIWF